jgi:DNA polymerase I
VHLAKQKKLVLIDGSSYLYRAFHALPPLTNAKNQPTGAIYGVINMLKKLLNEYKPEYLAVIFDAKSKNFRHEIYPQYKATRPPMEQDLQVQIEPLYQIIQALGLPLIVIEGMEADDVIGVLAHKAAKEEHPVIISTGDKDMAQLVDNKITLINTMNNSKLDELGVKEKFGVTPKQIIAYLTLVGDASDNIPGVTGIGPKTAAKLLTEYETLENIVKNIKLIKGKIGENLSASLEKLPLIQKLVTIRTDFALNINLEDLRIKEQDNKKLRELFTELEFKNWLTELTNNKSPATTAKYQIILTEDNFLALLNELNNAQKFSFDLETTGLDIIQAEIVGLSFALKTNEAFYIPVGHDYEGAPIQLERNYVLNNLKSILENPHKIKMGQNIKYDMNILANYHINLQGIGYDTALESYILNTSVNKHDKESLALKYLGKNITTYEELAGKGTKQIKFNQVELNKAAPYAAADADLVLQLHEVLWPQIASDKEQVNIFQKIEMPLISVLSRIERYGVKINEEILQNLSHELATRLKKIEQQVYLTADSEFNINSPAQLQEILYEKLKLPILKKTPTGQPSTAEPVLQELALDYGLPKMILEYRSLSKLKSTYADTLPQQVDHKTGRIHTSYNQTVTSTGRLSSTAPNLQNIPIRTEEGRKIRKAFIAEKNCKLISADYSQIELRVMAHLSQDQNLCQAFHRNIDIHKVTAAEIFNVNINNVTEIQRRNAKTINFGLIYGMAAFGLAKRLGVSNENAQKYIELYFTRYPGVKIYTENICKLAGDAGYVKTIFGRKIHISDIKAKKFALRAAAERAAINAPVQGTAADIIKIAMINVDRFMQTCDFKIKMIMQVHDELVFEVEDKYIPEATKEIKKIMEEAVKLAVPVVVNIGVGYNWDEAH